MLRLSFIVIGILNVLVQANQSVQRSGNTVSSASRTARQFRVADHSVQQNYEPIASDTPSHEFINDYGTYSNDFEEEDDNFSLIISEGVVSLAKHYLLRAASKLAALLFGGIAALAICKLTPLCSTVTRKYSSIQELKTVLTPERLNAASEVLNKAIETYSSLKKHY